MTIPNAQQALRLFLATGLPQAYTYSKAAGRRDQSARKRPAPAPDAPNKGARP